MTEGGIIATFTVKVTVRQAEGEDPANAKVQTPSIEGMATAVETGVKATWPWLEASARAERTDK